VQRAPPRQSDLVITGGVDTFNDIFMYMCFSKTPALSFSGDCRPFDAKSDGTMLGEGIGLVGLRASRTPSATEIRSTPCSPAWARPPTVAPRASTRR
jgi:hypothetical protein